MGARRARRGARRERIRSGARCRGDAGGRKQSKPSDARGGRRCLVQIGCKAAHGCSRSGRERPSHPRRSPSPRSGGIQGFPDWGMPDDDARSGSGVGGFARQGSGGVIAKICGITRVEDATLAVSLGATAIGFIFWPSSPRAISPRQARSIVAALPTSVTTVGVFVNATRDEIEGAADDAKLSAVQLHGDETPELARSLSRRVIKAIPLAGDASLRWREWPETMVLLDTHDPARRGGTGHVIDWDRAAAIARTRDVILAGGLRPANIVEAVTRVRPAGIDVSSGVESSPGIKDPEKLRALFDAL